MNASLTSSPMTYESLNKANQKHGTEYADGNRRLPFLFSGTAEAVTKSKQAVIARKRCISLSRGNSWQNTRALAWNTNTMALNTERKKLGASMRSTDRSAHTSVMIIQIHVVGELHLSLVHRTDICRVQIYP
jgi:hypothetical protein